MTSSTARPAIQRRARPPSAAMVLAAIAPLSTGLAVFLAPHWATVAAFAACTASALPMWWAVLRAAPDAERSARERPPLASHSRHAALPAPPALPSDLGGLSGESPPPASPSSVAEQESPGSEGAPASLPGTTVPPAAADQEVYEIVEPLGEGQMGMVYKARHRNLGRVAALKMLQPGQADAVDVGRFEREARVIAGLVTPHIVTVYDFGRRLDGTLYFAMELLDGVNLQELVVDYGPMPPARVLRILCHVLSGLSIAHAAGVVHRDLKPHNVLLCRKGAELEVAKILDFGLAKAEPSAGEAPPEARITRAGLVLGTPAYVAPESLKGSHEVDGRADLYAVGCIGFWLLTGELVFDYDRPMAMVRAHAQEAPRRVADVCKTRVPPELDQAIDRFLKKSPQDRPRDADEALSLLSSIESDEPWTLEDAERWWLTHRRRQSLDNVDPSTAR